MRRCWRKVLPRVALQGVGAVINAATDRGIAVVMHTLTGVWAEERGWQSEEVT